MGTERKIDMSETVYIDNTRPWDVSFASLTINNHKGYLVPANAKEWFGVDVQEVKAQIRARNVAFVGKDGKGSHACFRICDPDMRKYFFGSDAETFHISKEKIDEVFSKKTKASVKSAIDALITNHSEARIFKMRFEELDLSNEPQWKVDMVWDKLREHGYKPISEDLNYLIREQAIEYYKNHPIRSDYKDTLI